MDRPEFVLVTGGAGFIGSHLVAALVADGRRVRVVDNLATGYARNLDPVRDRIEWLEGDLADFATAERAVAGVEAILHEAAIPSVPRSVAEPLLSHASGPTATIHLLEAARLARVRRCVFAASSSAYGDTEELPKHEEMLPRPHSPYAAGKLACEYYVQVYARTMGLDGACLRYFNVFGPRQDPSSPYSGVISRFLSEMRAGRRPVIFGDGRQTRDFTYVANVVDANLRALDRREPLGGVVLNVGTGRSVSLIELAAAINRILGTDLEPEFLPARPGDVRDSLASLDRIERVLGYRPVVDFEAGLRLTAEAER